MNQLTAALTAADTTTTPAPAAATDLPIRQLRTGTVQSVEDGSSTPPVAKPGKIRAAFTRWFGGWDYMSVEGFFTSTGTSNVGFILVGPYFIAIPRPQRPSDQP